jgi:tRNA (guanine26-N2/guanine27-N2)-dimethyltransferase
MPLRKIEEGKLKIYESIEDIPTKKMGAFYNPEMSFDRSLSEIIIQIINPKKALDGMSASGVRGLRYASVLPDSEVVLNELNPKAVKLIEKNLAENKAILNPQNIRIENKNLYTILGEEMFDFIDIDPFGSPIYFLDSAARSIRNKGVVAFTATDTAALFGTSPNAGLRKYGIKSLRCDFSKELGLRILITAAIRKFAEYEIEMVPVFSYCRRHYFRVFGQVRRGAKRADRLLESFEYISYCQKCGWRDYGIFGKCKNCKSQINLIGPIFTGDFASIGMCGEMLKYWWPTAKEDDEKGKFVPDYTRFIQMVSREQGYPPYYDIHHICKLNKCEIKKTEVLLKELEGVRTHFLGTGIKTKKGFKEALKSLK